MTRLTSDSIRLISYLSTSVLLSLSFWTLLFLPAHLSGLSWSSQKIGWAMGLYFLAHLFAQFLAGSLTMRIGNVGTALLGASLGAVAGLAYLTSLFAADLIFVARACHGAGAGLVSASVLIHLIESVPAELKGRMMGYFGLPGFVMLGVGPLVSQYLQSHWGIGATFSLVLLTFLLSALPLLALPRPLISSRRRRRLSVAVKVNFPRIRSILLVALLFGVCFSVWPTFLAPAVRTVGTSAVSLFGLSYGIGAVAARLSFSLILEGGRRYRIAGGGLMLFGVLLASLPHLHHPWLFALTGVLCGAVHGVYYPALSSIAAERFHPLVPGHGMSLYVSAASLGLFIGPPIWGIVADLSSYAWTFAIAGGVLILSASLFVSTESRRQSRGGGSRRNRRKPARQSPPSQGTGDRYRIVIP